MGDFSRLNSGRVEWHNGTVMEPPLAYVILGASGSGRREVLADLLGGLEPSDRVVVCFPEEEPEEPGSPLADLESFVRAVWRRTDEGMEAAVPEGVTHFFFLSHGGLNPVDQVEAFYHWSGDNGVALARILTVVHCRLAFENPDLAKWYDACIHFSDYVLLNRRENLSEKWIKDFQERYRKAFYPCIFERVKKGRVKNPALVLDPLPRRLSHLFDPEPPSVEDDEMELGDDSDPEEEEGDPYLVRLPSGRRAKEIPEIGAYVHRTAERDSP